ncbi:divalent-cation tolerance protein CutA [Actinoalloteichus sp. AHMU CJ021]|uniref:Divalent cation tolerance protein n=1 Tax=Actinoalloteichus caeruleus DSM 43889 TaxID=1120930 RepID=A0ABT1JFB3_ACTCY|nr:divalent-cation tolerance protein CutA [Actinoalloteichus caeruleus]AUS77366.1 divalent-cation tolerance protein CutA [Actinoalloteichus sp. AHMU CJ021]MCP2331187.1 divalent cation tolerance protein [Actinoalloteichus caeruleus DSM 43889]
MAYALVVTTTDSVEAAESLARSAVDERLAACAQIVGPVTSVYRWEGEVQTDREWQVVCKTTGAASERLVEHLRSAHSYDVPEVIVVPITSGNPAYLAWMDEETT